jgi:hypothetical protein
MITIPLWVVYVVLGYLILNAISNALSLTQRDFYTFFVKFMRNLTLNLAPFMEQELHIKLPQVEVPPTDADVTKPPSAPTQN